MGPRRLPQPDTPSRIVEELEAPPPPKSPALRFAGRLLDWANTILRTTLHIVRKPADQRGFVVIPRRWAVERTFGWLTAHRRLARDYERHPAHSEAMIRWAAINTITRRTARGEPATRQQKRVFTTST